MNAHTHGYLNGPGHRGVDTSIIAADRIAPVAGKLRKMVLDAIQTAGPDGLTAEDLADVLGEDKVSVQPRTSELRALGLITPAGHRRLNRRGNTTIVWVIAEAQGSLALGVPDQGAVA